MNDEQAKQDENTTENRVDAAAELAALRAENAELKRTSQIGAARDAVTAALGRLGAASPGLLFEAAKADLQFGESGGLENLEALVAKLQRTFPEQFAGGGSGSIDAGAGRHSAPQLTRELLGRMKPADIAKLDWSEVRRVLAS
jgi:hypothetical protein